MRIVWDEVKRIANLEKHGFDFTEIDIAFFETAAIQPAKGRRYMALGPMRGRVIAVVFSPLGLEAVSIISARPANARERKLLDG